MSPLKVLVVGASIAGPTTAYWLAKAGAHVTIIERFPSLRPGGQNVDIRTTGVTIMRKMAGMEAAVRARILHMDGFSWVHEDGRSFATITASGDPDQQSLISEYEILRGDLAQVLYDLTKDNEHIKYVFDEQVASLQQKGESPVLVEFANHLPPAEFDLVVACDGSTSRTRAMGLGCGVRDHIEPLDSWAAYFSVDQDLLQGSKMGQALSISGGRFLAVGPDPSGVNRVTTMSFHSRNGSNAMSDFRNAVKQGGDALKEYVADRYQGIGWKAHDIFNGMIKSKDFYASEIVQVKVPRLYTRRFVLVGDAGYSAGLTGCGTSLAITGAYVLAGEISDHGNDLAAALSSYEERMKPIIQDMQKVPLGVATILAPHTAWGLWLRDLFLATVTRALIFGKFFSWAGQIFASSFGKDKYNLPNYEWRN